MYNSGYNVYKNNSVNYASKEQLLLMLVDGAVKFIKRANYALEKGDLVKTHENLIKTQDIIAELMSSLDRNAGEWAIQLFKVYRFIYDKLVEVNIKKDLEGLKEVIPLVEDIRDLWYETYEKAKRNGI